MRREPPLTGHGREKILDAVQRVAGNQRCGCATTRLRSIQRGIMRS
jgi:hypothetical protein